MALYGDDPKKKMKKTMQNTKVDKSTPTGKAFNNDLDKIRSLSVKETVKPMMQKLVRDVQYKPSGTVPKKNVNLSGLVKALEVRSPKQ
jgi:hypothetical protein